MRHYRAISVQVNRFAKDCMAILSEPPWIRRFGGDRSIIGKTIQIDHVPHRVTGVVLDVYPR